jgi:hypothetical protein
MTQASYNAGIANTILYIVVPTVLTGEWRKLHNKELNDPYCSPNIVRVIKSIRMRLSETCSTYGRGERRIQDFGVEN